MGGRVDIADSTRRAEAWARSLGFPPLSDGWLPNQGSGTHRTVQLVVSSGRFPWVGGMSEIAFALDRGFGVVQRAER